MFSIVKRDMTEELKAVARQLRLSPDVVGYCLEVELIQQALTETDLAELRRIRRLQELEVNLAGAEIILRMRRRLLEMQAKMEAMMAEMEAVQARFEQDLRKRDRELANDL